MKRKIHFIFIIFLTGLLLTQCDLIIGSGENANVTIDLAEFWGESASRGVQLVPDDTTATLIRVSVFGVGMQKIVKTASPGTRYINMYVPAGNNRHFTLESFFTLDRQSTFAYPHMRSFKGRASADLKPGSTVKLLFRMVAGATQLLVPDKTAARIFWADQIADFNASNWGTLGTSISPNDLDISPAGLIITANDGTPGIITADTINGIAQVSTSSNCFSIAVDRENDFLYYYTGRNTLDRNSFPTLGSELTLNRITSDGNYQIVSLLGMDVDPWTGRLYIVGLVNLIGTQTSYNAFILYDPNLMQGQVQGVILSYITQNEVSQIRELQDVIVKDEGVFVLNQVPTDDLTTPIILKFDRNLNYLGGFGTISSVDVSGRYQMVASAAPGKFYHPKRFFAHENEGLYIVDDSAIWDGQNGQYDKVVYVNEALDPSSWTTYPATQEQGQGTTDPFTFIEY